MNILFTSVGNLAFPTVKESLKRPGFKCKIVGTDIDRLAHGFSFCDKSYLVHIRHHRDYFKQIQEICKKENIDVVWPLSTEDQDYFSYHGYRFKNRGIEVVCSSISAVDIANNKSNLYQHLKEQGIFYPSFFTLQSGSSIDYIKSILDAKEMPFVIKPRTGKGGRDTHIVTNDISQVSRNDRQFVINYQRCIDIMTSCLYPEHMVICEYLPGNEFSVDTLSKDGEFYYGVVRQRFKSTGGLALEAEVVDNHEILELAKSVVESVGLSYINNIQIKMDICNVPKVMEINPRIPGGLSLSIEAGADIIFDTIKLLQNEKINKPKLEYGLCMKRYWSAVYTTYKERDLVKHMDLEDTKDGK